MRTNERIFLSIGKIFEKGNNFKLLCRCQFFVFFQYFAVLFLVLMKLIEENLKETKFFEENLVAYLVFKVSFSLGFLLIWRIF